MNAIPRRAFATGIRRRILALPLILIALAAVFFGWTAWRSAYSCDPPPSGCTCGGTPGGSCVYDGQCGGTYNCATDATYGCNAGAGKCSCGGTICKRTSKPCNGSYTCATDATYGCNAGAGKCSCGTICKTTSKPCGGLYNCATNATYGCNAGAGKCSCGTICKTTSKPCGGLYNCATHFWFGCEAGVGNCSCGTRCTTANKPCSGTQTCAQMFACTRCGTAGKCETHSPPCGPFCSLYTGGRACDPATQTCCGGCYGRTSGYYKAACECGNSGGNPPDEYHCDTVGHCSYAADCNCPPAATQCICTTACPRCQSDAGKCMHCPSHTTGSCSNNSANCCWRWLGKQD